MQLNARQWIKVYISYIVKLIYPICLWFLFCFIAGILIGLLVVLGVLNESSDILVDKIFGSKIYSNYLSFVVAYFISKYAFFNTLKKKYSDFEFVGYLENNSISLFLKFFIPWIIIGKLYELIPASLFCFLFQNEIIQKLALFCFLLIIDVIPFSIFWNFACKCHGISVKKNVISS